MNKLYLPALLTFFLSFAIQPTAMTQITITLNGNPPLCGGFATGSILASVSGGQSPYQFDWSNGQTGNPITGLPAGPYSLTVTDQDGNQAVDSIVLIAPPPLEVPITVTACSPPGAITALPSGGTPPYSLSWNTGDTTASISGLPLGQYCITAQDANNCAFINCQYIGEPMTASIETTSAACNNPFGGGTAQAMVSGGVAPFDYDWDNGMTGPLIDSLPAGPVTVTITAYNGCSITVTDTVGLEENPLGVQVQTEEPGCAGDSTGWATANAPGAFPPVTYLWNTGDTTQSVYNLPAGTYTVTVQDFMGCEGIKTFQLDNASNLKLELEVENPTCNGVNNGRIKVNPLDGVPPFIYKWNTGDSTQSLENLSPGLYIVTVSDDVGCFKVDSVSLVYPPPLQVSFTVKNTSHCAAKDGSITPSVSGGSWPFTFAWSNGTTDSILHNAGAGTYSVTITSAEGCQLIDSATVAQPNNLMVSVSGTSLVCGNENTGMLNASVQYGSPPYQFVWNNGETTPAIDSLGPGMYSVTVTSAEGCIGQGSKTIFNSPAVTFTSELDSISCNGAADGHIGIEIQSGLAPFAILWNTGETTPQLNGLSGGVYQVTVTDIAGCEATESYQIQEPAPLQTTINSDAGTCDADAQIEAIAIGGTPPYNYQWSTGENGPVITSSVGGDFTVTVTDAHGCSVTQSTYLPDIPGIQLDIFGTGTSCFGKNDGTIVALASAGTPPFQYSWSTGASGNGIGNLPAGDFSVTVTDLLGCTQSATYTITEGPALAITLVAPEYSCVGDPVNATVIAPANAVHPLIFQWSDGQITQMATGLDAGAYSVTMTDALGCKAIDSVLIQQGGDFAVSLNQTDISCFGEADGSISLSTSGGISPFQVEWSNGETGNSISQLGAGVYEATITEIATGCTKVVGGNIDEPAQLTTDVETEDGFCGEPAHAELVISGGTQPWSVMWSNGETITNLETSASGQYFVQVTDARGCIASDTIELNVAPEPLAEITLLNYPDSPQLPDGALAVSYSNMELPVQINWNNNASGDTIQGLSPGIYSVTVSDAHNCEIIRQFEIPQFAEAGDFVWFDQNGNGIQDAGESGIDSITVQISGLNFIGDNLDRTTATDSSGHYKFVLPPGEYVLQFHLTSGYEFTIPNAGGDDNFDSDADPQTGLTQSFQLNSGEIRAGLDAGFIPLDTCHNVTEAGSICCDTMICLPGGSSVLLNETEAATGGSGDLIFQWYENSADQPFDPMLWQAIPASNTASLEVEPAETTYFIRTVRRAGCSALLPTAPVRISIQKVPQVEVQGPKSICEETAYSFEVIDPATDAIYSWEFSETASTAAAQGEIVPYVSWAYTADAWLAINTSIGACLRTDTLSLGETEACTDEQILLHGKVVGTDALLDWKWPTDSLSSLQFELEWATPATAFIPISTTDSTAAGQDSTHFFHLHFSPPSGKNYYRLRLNRSNGDVELSNVVQLILGTEGNLVHAYPNPFGDALTLELINDYNSSVSYQVVDAIGRKWLEGSFDENEVQKSIATDDLASGLYFVLIRYDGALVKVIKLVRR
ncbi:MAG: hypothetical protein CMN32_12355 [Saprospirales bacterium]|nr:hypothetical protein [Saprospirales bacterium]